MVLPESEAASIAHGVYPSTPAQANTSHARASELRTRAVAFWFAVCLAVRVVVIEARIVISREITDPNPSGLRITSECLVLFFAADSGANLLQVVVVARRGCTGLAGYPGAHAVGGFVHGGQ